MRLLIIELFKRLCGAKPAPRPARPMPSYSLAATAPCMPVIMSNGNGGFVFTDKCGRDWYPSSWQALEWLFAWLRRVGRV